MTQVDVVIPVYNEERALADSVRTLRAFLSRGVPFAWQIVIADNASTDSTWAIAQNLAATYPDVRALHLDQKGRGRALRRAWLSGDADVVSYMDVDLSTNLKAFPPLIRAITDEGADIAIGTRLARRSRVTRTLRREIISQGYNLLVKALFLNHFSDAQCGFKALTREAARNLLPQVKDQTWFFDTELLLLAEAQGYRIAEVPVEWVEDLDTRVKIVRTALDDVRGLLRVRRTIRRRKRRIS